MQGAGCRVQGAGLREQKQNMFSAQFTLPDSFFSLKTQILCRPTHILYHSAVQAPLVHLEKLLYWSLGLARLPSVRRLKKD